MPTLDQYMTGIAKAERAGDMEAAEFLRKEASAKMTGPASTLEKMGAGVQDVVLGAKQFFGGTTPEEVREHNRIAQQATGGTFGGELIRHSLPLAASVLIPGAGTVRGATAIGAATGALMPTEFENVAAGKALGAGIGGAVGAAGQKALNVVAPFGERVLSKTLGGMGNIARRFTPGGREQLAERALAESASDPAAVQQALATAQPSVSGARQSAAAISNDPRMLSAEHALRKAGGEIGEPLEQMSAQANKKQWEHLQGALGKNVADFDDEANWFARQELAGMNLRRPFDARGNFASQLATEIERTDNPALKAELERIAAHYASVLKTSGGGGGRGVNVERLHNFRMTALDDALSRLYQTDKKAANTLRDRIINLEQTFDREMDWAVGGGNQWSKFLQGYRERATARDQARAGAEFLEQRLETLPPTLAGPPELAGMRNVLTKEPLKETVRGRPLYSQEAQEAMGGVGREIDVSLRPYAQAVEPRGSAQAAPKVLRHAIEAQRRGQGITLEDLAAGSIGYGLGDESGLGGAAGLFAGRRFVRHISDKQAIDIARRMSQLYADPQRAAQALARSPLPNQAKQMIMEKLLSSQYANVLPAGAATYATRE